MTICIAISASFRRFGPLFQLVDLFFLHLDLPQAGLQLDDRFTLFPHIYDFGALAHRADPAQLDTLLIKENASLLPILVLQLGQVLDHSVDVEALHRFVLLKHRLHLSHLLIKHSEQLG